MLKVFADYESPMVFTTESIHVVLGYTYKRIGNTVLSDGTTPAEVMFTHPNGQGIVFTFKNGESTAKPSAGPNVKSNERLMMVDAAGWATTKDPVYWDLYTEEGEVIRFLASEKTCDRGRMIYVKDSRGVVTTPEDMGIDIVYDANGVRQFLTPSRLADIQTFENGFDITVYPILNVPAKNSNLYQLPQITPESKLTLRRGKGDAEAVVTYRSGSAETKRYVYNYVDNDWSLTHPDGIREAKALSFEEGVGAAWSKEIRDASGSVLSSSVQHFGWENGAFALTNITKGCGGVQSQTSWINVIKGNGVGHIKTEFQQSGLRTDYEYDSASRITRKTRSGKDMMMEVTEESYASVDPSDVVPPVDSRPRTTVKKIAGVEVERTYHVYAPWSEITERAATQGAAYGAAGAMRTVRTYWDADSGVKAGKLKSVRHEDGRFDVYDYTLVTNVWTETVTHLHEQAMDPVSGKTTRDISVMNVRGETLEYRTEAYIAGTWYTVAKTMQEYNAQGKVVRSTDLAGRVTTTAWDCCHKISETKPDGRITTWDYDAEGRMIASSRLIPLDATNVTWVTTCYRYDAMGRQTATWTTNYTEHVGTPATTTSYDGLGRVISRTIPGRGTSYVRYSANGLVVTNIAPNGATSITFKNSNGDTLSITGTGVTPEFMSRGVLADGTRWTKIVQGETADSPRFTKRYENMLGQSVRSEKSGFRSAVLASVNTYDAYGRLVSTASDGEPTSEITYDALGNRVATTTLVGGGLRPPRNDGSCEWRKSESHSAYALLGNDVWTVQTNITSCSDTTIPALTQSRADRVTGLTPALVSQSLTTDARGNVSESRAEFDGFESVSINISPAQTGRAESHSRLGVAVRSVSASGVETRSLYDGLGRQVASIDGRGNATRTEYDAFGRRIASVDPDNNRTTYGYDTLGQLVAVTNALGDATVYAYDIRGRKTYEGGARYPARYSYDVFNAITNITTYIDEKRMLKNESSYLYDLSSRLLTSQVDSAGGVVSFVYSSEGRLISKRLACGTIVHYSVDSWNNITNITYSDLTPSVSFRYDPAGRVVEIGDAGGKTCFSYDAYGQCNNEISDHIEISRCYDVYGRDRGYVSSIGVQTTNIYDEVTGRMTSTSFNGTVFKYSYVEGTDYIASVEGPSIQECVRLDDKTGRVSEIFYTNDTLNISRRYNYDRIGNVTERVQVRNGSETRQDKFMYDGRGQLTNAVLGSAEYSYAFDDVGNRLFSEANGVETSYLVDKDNRYLCVSNAIFGCWGLSYDADGNQNIVLSQTGEWHVKYDGENRPVRWSCGVTNVVFTYDGVGRRIGRKVLVNDIVLNEHKYYYSGAFRIADFLISGGQTSLVERVFWDPSRSLASRPLLSESADGEIYFFAIDLTRNVCELVDREGNMFRSYDYSPYGETHCSRTGVNSSYLWSSELYDEYLGICAYFARDYNPLFGRWLGKDLLGDGNNRYLYANNNPMSKIDILGFAVTEADCEKTKNNLLNGDMRNSVSGALAQQLMNALREDPKCQIPQIQCTCCDSASKLGSFKGSAQDSSGVVEICQNNQPYSGAIYSTIVHELIHAYDSCKGVDFTDCEQRACSEIRAAKNSGQCQLGGTHRRTFAGLNRTVFFEGEDECIKRSAKGSMGVVSVLCGTEDYVEKVYTRCVNDSSPF